MLCTVEDWLCLVNRSTYIVVSVGVDKNWIDIYIYILICLLMKRVPN